MSRNGRVLLAMSGGVDSSVAACLLREQGYDVVGVFLRVGAESPPRDDCAVPGPRGSPHAVAARRLKHGCCSATDAADARVVAGRLGIPFYALNFRDEFERIIDYFVDEYRRGRTPNPCVMCNIQVKFGRLFAYADLVNADFVATGHYARVVTRARGPALARATHRAKDQSYVLFGIERHRLDRLRFPVGEMDKHEVRDAAASLGLAVADKPDSQEICFVPDQDYVRLVRDRSPDACRPGDFRDSAGHRLGTHAGVAAYTVGQRRGLGLALGRPVYVTRLDVLSNTVYLGPRDELLRHRLAADRVNWLADPPRATEPHRAAVQIRHMHTAAPATIRCAGGDRVDVAFDEPQSAVTPGQAAVFYDDDVVLGGGWIVGHDAA